MSAGRLIILLLLCCGALRPAAACAQDSRGPPPLGGSAGFHLEPNTPNPVDSTTWIPFVLEEALFARGDAGVVTIRIVNVLRQLVAIPVAMDHPKGRALPLLNLPYTTAGRKVAYWDGKDTAGRKVPSGTYYCEMWVSGKSATLKLVVPARPRLRIPWFGRRGRPG